MANTTLQIDPVSIRFLREALQRMPPLTYGLDVGGREVSVEIKNPFTKDKEMTTSSAHFQQAYKRLLGQVHNAPIETNARTKTRIKALPGGVSFKLDVSDGHLPVAGNRRFWPHIAASEVAWQFMGTKDPTFILEKAPKLWSKFVQDGEIKAAYGYRWRERFGRDQLQAAIETLREDPSDRQCYISAWDPEADGLGTTGVANIPCPVGFSLTCSDDLVHASVFIRSSDVYVGLPYDVAAYALTLDAIAASLDRKPGTLHFTLAHAHLYEPHWDHVSENLGKSAAFERGTEWLSVGRAQPHLPALSVEEIVDAPDAYVRYMRRLARRVQQNEWDPTPELVV